jgi:hypothetical protein
MAIGSLTAVIGGWINEGNSAWGAQRQSARKRQIAPMMKKFENRNWYSSVRYRTQEE